MDHLHLGSPICVTVLYYIIKFFRGVRILLVLQQKKELICFLNEGLWTYVEDSARREGGSYYLIMMFDR